MLKEQYNRLHTAHGQELKSTVNGVYVEYHICATIKFISRAYVIRMLCLESIWVTAVYSRTWLQLYEDLCRLN